MAAKQPTSQQAGQQANSTANTANSTANQPVDKALGVQRVEPKQNLRGELAYHLRAQQRLPANKVQQRAVFTVLHEQPGLFDAEVVVMHQMCLRAHPNEKKKKETHVLLLLHRPFPFLPFFSSLCVI